MNRKQRIEMLLRALLCPFLQLPARQEDLLCAKARAYGRMVASGDRASQRAYEAASAELQRWLEGRTRPERLSEMESLLEMFYPEEELRTYLAGPGHENLDGYYIEVLFQLAAEFITLRDGQISIRMWDEPGKDRFFQGGSGLYKVELWSVLSRIVTPDVLIAAYFVGCGIDSIQQLAGVSDNLSLSDTLLAAVARRGVAETHMHLSAGMSYLAVWQVVTDPAAQRIFAPQYEPLLQKEQRREQQEHTDLLIAGWLRLLLARYLEDTAKNQTDLCDYYYGMGEEDELERHILRHMLGGRFDSQEIAHLRETMGRHHLQDLHHLEHICPSGEGNELDVLFRGPYRRYRSFHLEAELILLCAALRHIREHPGHRQFLRVFLDYIRMKNYYFTDKQQTFGGGGLAFFHRYFTAASSAIWRTTYEDNIKVQLMYQSAFRSQFHCANLRKLEVKISPQIPTDWEKQLPYLERDTGEDKRAIARQLYQVFTAYLQVCRERSGPEPVPCLGVVYHFIKEDVHRPPDRGCWLSGEEPMDGVSRMRAQCLRFLRALHELLAEVPRLADYVVGVDAASRELHTEPWVFAPVYRYARSRISTMPLHPETGMRMQNLGLTYHVGEDYRHILTGLRHVDEVITHFGYKAGDRLGHAMALQVDIERWVHDHETIPVARVDRLEDLIWLWSLGEDYPEELGKYRYELESRIMDLASELLHNIRGLSPYVIRQAYLRKFKLLEPDFCQAMRQVYLEQEPPGARRPPLRSLDTQRSFCCHVAGPDYTWDADKLLLIHYCPIYTRHLKRPVLVSTQPADCPMLQAVQRCIRRKVQDQGIYVETNPTSNVSIGDVSSLRDYPITRLNSPPCPSRIPCPSCCPSTPTTPWCSIPTWKMSWPWSTTP